MQMLEFIEELAKKICEIELCVSNLRGIAAFHGMEGVGTRDKNYFVAQWLVYAYPCRPKDPQRRP